MRSRCTLAMTDAAATEAQSRSAFTWVCTLGGLDSAGVSQSWAPSSSTTLSWIRAPCSCNWVSARRPARPNAAMMPTVSTSSAVARPTAECSDQSVASGESSSRRFSLSSFESRSPSGCSPTPAATSDSPTATGPAIAPRPTSSHPITKRAPSRCRARSTARVGSATATN